jgi:hypothetical protein
MLQSLNETELRIVRNAHHALVSGRNGVIDMPTLVRLLTALLFLAGAVFAAMAALVFLVEPTQHPVVIDLPLDQLRPPPAPGQPMVPPR